jgi:predicted nucleotidyltransferase
MIDVKKEIRRFLRSIRKFEEFERVKFIILFGSAAKGKITEESDIDVCIYFDGSFRKILVHNGEIENEIAYEEIKNGLKDFEEFEKEIEKFLEKVKTK